MTKKTWKVGKKIAGIRKDGTRFMVDTVKQAKTQLGLKSKKISTKKVAKSNPEPKKRRKNMAGRRNKTKKKGTTKRKRQFTISLSLGGALLAGFTDPVRIAVVEKNPFHAAQLVAARYCGLDMRSGTAYWNWYELGIGVGSLIAGGLIHKFVGGAPLNVNRMLGQAGVPVIRI